MERYFCFNVYCNIFIASAGPPVNVTCNIFFINSFGSVTETTMVSATMPLAREKHELIMPWTQPVKFSIYCSTCRTSCKCYLQHIYQQLWVNSRNYNGEWDWALKPSWWRNGMCDQRALLYICGTFTECWISKVYSPLESN